MSYKQQLKDIHQVIFYYTGKLCSNIKFKNLKEIWNCLKAGLHPDFKYQQLATSTSPHSTKPTVTRV